LLLPLALTAVGCSATTTDTTNAGGTVRSTTAGGGSTTGTSTAPNKAGEELAVVKVGAKEDGDAYTYDAPASLKTGWAKVILDNGGKLPHQLNIARVQEGKEEAIKSVLAGPTPDMAAAFADAFIGGPNNVSGGSAGEAIVDFDKPGTYALLCFIASPPDLEPHLAHGMVEYITVTAGPTPAIAPVLPKVEGEIEMQDFEWFLPDSFTGKGWYKLTNTADQPHELAVHSLADGKTAGDAKAYLTSTEPPSGPPPFGDRAGAAGLSKTNVSYIRLDLKPGRYVLLCFIPDSPPPAHDLKPHFAHGMVKEITTA